MKGKKNQFVVEEKKWMNEINFSPDQGKGQW